MDPLSDPAPFAIGLGVFCALLLLAMGVGCLFKGKPSKAAPARGIPPDLDDLVKPDPREPWAHLPDDWDH